MLREESTSRSAPRPERAPGARAPQPLSSEAFVPRREGSRPGNFVRRHFEPLMLSAQVLVDLLVVLFACWVGYQIGLRLGGIPEGARAVQIYRELSALIAAICLVTFHFFGMYNPTKSLLNMKEYEAIAKSTIASFLLFFTLVLLLRTTQQEGDGGIYSWLVPVHGLIDIDVDPESISRLAVVVIFGLILVLMTANRFAAFRLIQSLHQRGIGNRNVLIYGAGETGRHLQHKFQLVPTLGLNLIGFVDDDASLLGSNVGRSRVLGSFGDLQTLIGVHKVSEVFVALAEHPEDRVLEIIAELEQLGVSYRVVPRFYNLLSFKVRIEALDSIPLITRADRTASLPTLVAKRLLDLIVSSAVLVLSAPLFVVVPILIKRESKGPVFFVQTRIGRDGRPFRMLKFRTMHVHLGGDAPTPRSPFDPRITRIGRWLRRYSLDELPQFVNVLVGTMSVVGPRPEMPFIVEQYGPLQKERLRAKPGITGLWQISYARQMAIHDNLDYDLYYIEHQSLLLDLVILTLTAVAVVKGTGAY